MIPNGAPSSPHPFPPPNAISRPSPPAGSGIGPRASTPSSTSTSPCRSWSPATRASRLPRTPNPGPPTSPTSALSSQPGLHQHFRQSAIYLCASRYEPFGLAPLEAALCGCALVLRDLPSLREIWGNSALFFGHRRPHPTPRSARQQTRTPRRSAAAPPSRVPGSHTPQRLADSYLHLCEGRFTRLASLEVSTPCRVNSRHLAYLSHTLRSDWNNGNAHFLRGLLDNLRPSATRSPARTRARLVHRQSSRRSGSAKPPSPQFATTLPRPRPPPLRLPMTPRTLFWLRAPPKTLDFVFSTSGTRPHSHGSSVQLRDQTRLQTPLPRHPPPRLFLPRQHPPLGTHRFDGVFTFGEVAQHIYQRALRHGQGLDPSRGRRHRLFHPLPHPNSRAGHRLDRQLGRRRTLRRDPRPFSSPPPPSSRLTAPPSTASATHPGALPPSPTLTSATAATFLISKRPTSTPPRASPCTSPASSTTAP